MDIKNAVKDLAKKTTLNVKKYSPEILTIGAIGFGIATVVCTWFAARKTDEALTEPKAIIERAKCTKINDAYTKKDQSKEITYGYLKGGLAIAKLYGPAALMGSFSIACILGSYKILSRRNAGLIAVNGFLQKEFSDYRDKVIEKYGKDEDYNLRFGDKIEEGKEAEAEENGDKKTDAKPIGGLNRPVQASDFSRPFDESSFLWKKDAQYNIWQLQELERTFKSRTTRDGLVRMNDVCDEFGWPRTKAGERWGWVHKKGTEVSDIFSFGLPLGDTPECRAWQRKMEIENQRYFWLDFNCHELTDDELPYQEV